MQGPNGRILPLPSDRHNRNQPLLFQPAITEGVEEIPIRIREDVNHHRRGRAQYRQHHIEM